MQYPKEVIDPKKQLADKLIELNGQITKEDRNAYIEKYPITQGNLSLYMNGTIYDIEKAMGMVKFFKKRIEDRNKQIQELIN